MLLAPKRSWKLVAFAHGRQQRRGEKNGRCLLLAQKPQEIFSSFLFLPLSFSFSTALECFRDGNLHKSLPAAGRMNHHRCVSLVGLKLIRNAELKSCHSGSGEVENNWANESNIWKQWEKPVSLDVLHSRPNTRTREKEEGTEFVKGGTRTRKREPIVTSTLDWLKILLPLRYLIRRDASCLMPRGSRRGSREPLILHQLPPSGEKLICLQQFLTMARVASCSCARAVQQWHTNVGTQVRSIKKNPIPFKNLKLYSFLHPPTSLIHSQF